MTDLNPPRPMGQLLVDRQKERFVTDAAPHGWVKTSHDPLVLSRGDRQIMIEFNSGGIPKSAKWLGGEEFSSMGATGYMNLNEVYRWFVWQEPR